MQKHQFENKEKQLLKHSILKNYPSLSERKISVILKNKDIKVNGKRVNQNIEVEVFDIIEFYIEDDAIRNPLEIVYEDDNILIANKPVKMETTSPNKSVLTLEKLVQKKFKNARAVHRLDTNTRGLVIFALNDSAYFSLLDAFKNGGVEKYYQAVVVGDGLKKRDSFKDYLIKDEKKSFVQILSYPKTKDAKIAMLDYEVLETKNALSLLNIKLVTGRTHQIRAQLAKHKIYVVGDGKYGDKNINRQFKQVYQNLVAYKIIFHFDKKSYLAYLNNLFFEIKPRFNIFK